MARGVVEQGLHRGAYRRLLGSAKTHRERLLVRLGGEVGLRPFEMVRVTPADVRAQVVDGRIHYFLRAGEGDGRRDAYLRDDVRRELDRYVQSNGVGDDEPVVDVTPRRVQMLVRSVAERAAEDADDPISRVSTSDLRRYFARDLLVERELPPAVVMRVGGWNSVESIAPFLEDPDRSDVAAAFAAAATDGSRPRSGDDGRFRAALDRLDRAVLLFDGDATVEYANRHFERVTGTHSRAAVGRTLRDLSVADPGEYVEVWEAVTAGRTWTGGVSLSTADATSVECRATVVPVHSGGDLPTTFLATFDPDGEAASSVDGDGPAMLERLGRVQSAVRSAGDVLVDAGTREGVLQGVCDRLAESDAYAFAWVSDALGDQRTVPRTWAGVDEGTVERLALDDGPTAELADCVVRDRTVETGAVVDPDRFDAGRREECLVVGVPIVHGDDAFGALCVASHQRTLGEHERVELRILGERVGQVLAAVERKRLLLADSVLELELVSRDAGSFVVSTSRDLDCALRLEGIVPLDGGTLLFYLTVAGVAPDEVLDYLSDRVEDARLIADYSDESLLEVTVSGGSVPGTLVDAGGNVRTLVAEDGEAAVTCEFAPETNVRNVVDDLTTVFPDSELVAKREVERSSRSADDFERSLEERLTSKQLAVLQAAYHAGYFDWPRGSTAEDLADSMDVSSPTLHNHLRRAQRKLLDAFFSDADS